MIKVLIIDDSALTRSVLQGIMNEDGAIEVVSTAIDPIIAARKIQKFNPDVITLDLEMPRMDGLTFLKKLMATSPRPVIVISGNSPKASRSAISALDYGALEIIEKPDISTPEKLSEVSTVICDAVKAAYGANMVKGKQIVAELPSDLCKNPLTVNRQKISSHFIVIGSSTGGPDVLKDIFQNLNPGGPGYVIAQHMPAMFTKSFADRLNSLSRLHIKEAQDGEYIRNGQALVIPGDYHGLIKKDNEGYYVKLAQTEKVNRHRPSVDVLFESAAGVAGGKVTGIILTGMGEDGARGLLTLKKSGAHTVAQDSLSSVVFGMPKRAIEMGAAEEVLSPYEIVNTLNEIIIEKNIS